jgi:type I restriction enzyme S subunit
MRTARLGDLCDMRSGGTPRRGVDGYYGGTIPWVTIADMTSSDGVVRETAERITEAGLAAIGNRIFEPGTILLAMYGSVGKLAIAGSRLTTNQAILGLRPKEPNSLDSRYLLRWLASIQRKLIFDARGVTQANISKGLVEELAIPLPSFAEQRCIADILDKADAICRMRRQTIALTEELLRSAFLDMFGDPMTNPKGWPVKPLGELLANDPRIGTLVPASDKPGTLVVRVGELGAYDVELSRSKRASLSDEDFERFGIETGDVLLARAIGSEAHLGKASVLQPYNEPVAFDSHVMRLRFRDEVLDPYVFVQWLRTPGGRARFMSEAGRTAVQFNVNGKQIVKVQIPLPPRSEQRLFRRLFDSVRTMEQRSGAALRESESVFDSLVARAFAGARVATR